MSSSRPAHLPAAVNRRFGDGRGVQVELGRAVWNQRELWASFAIYNGSPTPYHLARVQYTDATELVFEARAVAMEFGTAPPDSEVIAVVAPGRRVRGVVHIPTPPEGYGPSALTFTDVTKSRRLHAVVDEWIFVPKRPEELEAEKRREAEDERERAERARERAARGRKTVLLAGGGGVLRLERGDDNTLVSAWDVAAQLVYSLGTTLSVDVGVGRLMSGQAELAGAVRSEAVYRAQIGARLLLGERGWIPYMRVGLGAALVSQRDDATSSLDLRAFGVGEVGISRRLADTFVIGLAAAVELGGGRTTAVAHGHVGFTWEDGE